MIGSFMSKKRKIFSDDIPTWLKYSIAIWSFASPFIGAWAGVSMFKAPPTDSLVPQVAGIATSTPNLADIFSKANSLATILERQGVLSRYKESYVYATSEVRDISKYGSTYYVDLDVEGVIVTCPIPESEERNKLIPILQGKQITIYGVFTYTNLLDKTGLIIGDCKILYI